MASAAEAAVPSIESVSPGVGQRGGAFELKIVGAGLDDVTEVLCYRKGTNCRELRSTSPNELTVTLEAAADCALGSHPFRLRSPRGLSELRTFRVTPFPVVASIEPNESAATAQPIQQNVTITGVAGADDVDCYRLSLKPGELISAEVEGVRLGGGLVDTKLEVFGPDGKLVAESDDTPLFRQDPFVSFVSERGGDYIVQVSETNRDGDDDSRYALHIGSFPRPQIVYPSGGESGKTIEITLLGDARGEFVQTLNLPADANGDIEVYPSHRHQTAPTPNCFRAVPIPNMLEREPNDAKPMGSAASLPCAFNGIVQSPGDTDQFAFTASEGETWRLELFGDRIGSPIDAVMSISDGHGQLLARCDDWESHDSRLDFAVPTTGEFILSVTDKRGSGGPLFVYRVEATPITPHLTAFFPRPNRLNQELQTICVPRGNRVMAYLGVQRDNVEGEAFLQVQKLPEGVSWAGGPIGEDRFWVPVVFQASKTAPIAGSLSGVDATVQFQGRTVSGSFRQVVDLVGGPADALYHSAEVDRVAIAVIEAAPIKVDVRQPSAPLAQDGTIALKVLIERRPGFNDPVDIVFPLLPPWVDGPSSLTFAADQTEAVYELRSWPTATPRTWKICAEARPGGSAQDVVVVPQPGRRRRSKSSVADFRVASELVELSISSSPVSTEAVTVAGEQGAQVPLTFRLKITGELPDELNATLEDLPNRVSAEPVRVDKSASEVAFNIRLEPNASLGEFHSIACRLSGQLKGQAVSYLVGRSTSLTVTRPGELVLGSDGRPLSRLEVLRRKQQLAPAAKTPVSEPLK